MKPIYSNLIGGFGNQMFQYAATRAFAEICGVEFKTPPWVGEKIFNLPSVNRPAKGDAEYPGYHQNQTSAIYTRSQVREWFKFKPEIENLLKKVPANEFALHLRDYGTCPGLATVSMKSFQKAIHLFGYDVPAFVVIVQGRLKPVEGFEDFDFLPDFYRLMTAKVLFRANSTFSWWAATLGDGKVYAPIMEGKPGGQVVDCEFVEGNYPRCGMLEFLTDIHLKP